MKYFLLAFLLTIFAGTAFGDDNYYYSAYQTAFNKCNDSFGFPFGTLINGSCSVPVTATAYGYSYAIRTNPFPKEYGPTIHVRFNFGSGSCPAGSLPDSSGLCVVAPSCPDSGTVVNGSSKTNNSTASSFVNIGGSRSIDGCLIASTSRTVDCYGSPSGTADCYVVTGFKYTGASASSDIPSLEDDTENPQSELPDTPPLADGDHTQDSIINNLGPVNVISLPDGSSVSTKIDQSIETKGEGVKISTTATTKTITDSNGLVKTEITTTTITTNADSSKSVNSVTDTNYTQTPTTITTVNTGSGSVTSNTSTAVTGSNQTSTTTNSDSNGNVTDSTSSSSGSGSGDGEGEGEEDSLSVNAASSQGTGSWFETSYPDGFQGILDSNLSGISSDIENSGFADTGISGAGTIPVWSMTFNLGPLGNFGTHYFSVPAYVWQFLSVIMLLTTLFLCRALVFGG